MPFFATIRIIHWFTTKAGACFRMFLDGKQMILKVKNVRQVKCVFLIERRRHDKSFQLSCGATKLHSDPSWRRCQPAAVGLGRLPED